jgi:cytidyltransferase-like protein
MKKVFTVGVFDVFHLGHLLLFERAKALGDYLIIAVQSSEFIKKFKPDAKVAYTTEQRIKMVENIRFVNEAIVYDSVDDIVGRVDFDVFVIGPDQQHDGFQKAIEFCRQNGKEVVVLERTKNISSSSLKDKIEDMFL